MLKVIQNFIVLSICLFLFSGCAVTVPLLHRADQKPSYDSKYFTVKPPVGTGWKYRESSPSEVLSLYFKYESDLFDEIITKRIGFIKYTAAHLMPHPADDQCYIEFYSMPSDPERFNYNARLMAEAENRKYLPHPAAIESHPLWGLKRIDEVFIGTRKFFEFEYVQTSDERLISLQYIHFSKDLRIMYVVNVPYIYKEENNVPEDVKTIIMGFQPLEKELSPTELVLERAANVLYDRTLDFVVRRYHCAGDPEVDKAIEDLQSVIKAEMNNYNAHLFLGALYLLQRDDFTLDHRIYYYDDMLPWGPVEGQDHIEHQGLWDYYYITRDDQVLNSLLFANMDVEKALEHFQNALTIKPDSFWANYYAAGLHLRHKDYKKAIMQYHRMIEYFPESALASYMLGVVYKESGDAKNALEAFSTAAHKNKKDKIFPDFGMGYLLKGKKNFKRQIKSLEKLK